MTEIAEAQSQDALIRERLRELVKDRSQSDLARKTNTLVSTVNRYLKSTKIPGEFLASVVEGLGVNPSWLLSGEGTPYLADVSAGTSEMAGNMLELVEAMNRVSRMKLGALTGKGHLKVLRELNDALERYEELRTVINKRTRVVFRELLDDFRVSLRDMDMRRATEIRTAAIQISRLCDEPNLTVEFDYLQEFYEHVFGDQERALELSRKVFVQSLGASDVAMDKDHCALAINLIVSLHRADRISEARRICRATLALYEDVGREWGRYKQLRALNAVLDIELGHLREGLRELHDTYPELPDQLRKSFSGKLVESMLLAGLAPLEYAVAIGVDASSKVSALLRFALLMDDRDKVTELLARYESQDCDEVVRAYANHWLNAKGTKAAKELERFEDATDQEIDSLAVRPSRHFAHAVYACHIAVDGGVKDRAETLFKASSEWLAKLGDLANAPVLTMARHHANALALFPESTRTKTKKQAREDALAFFRDHFQNGYGGFQPWTP